MCLIVRVCVCVCVCLSVHCIVEKQLIVSGCCLGRLGPMMRQVDGVEIASWEWAVFGVHVGASHCDKHRLEAGWD